MTILREQIARSLRSTSIYISHPVTLDKTKQLEDEIRSIVQPFGWATYVQFDPTEARMFNVCVTHPTGYKGVLVFCCVRGLRLTGNKLGHHNLVFSDAGVVIGFGLEIQMLN